jgi:HTH-like domain
VGDLQVRFGASQRQACRVMMMSRSLYRYRSRAIDQTLLVLRIMEIAAARVRYGYRRSYVLLRREGWTINLKRVYRLYRLEGLSLYQRRPKRSRAAQQRQGNPEVNAIHECWSMDFVSARIIKQRYWTNPNRRNNSDQRAWQLCTRKQGSNALPQSLFSSVIAELRAPVIEGMKSIDTSAEVNDYSNYTATAKARQMLSSVSSTTDVNEFQPTVDATLASIVAGT